MMLPSCREILCVLLVGMIARSSSNQESDDLTLSLSLSEGQFTSDSPDVFGITYTCIVAGHSLVSKYRGFY